MLHREYTNAPLMQRRQKGKKKKHLRNKIGWRMHKAQVPFKSSGDVNSFSGRQSSHSSLAATKAWGINISNWKQAPCYTEREAGCTSLWAKAIQGNSMWTWSNCGVTTNVPGRCFRFQDAGQTSLVNDSLLCCSDYIIWSTKTFMAGLANSNPWPLSVWSSR